MALRPLNERVIVKALDAEEKTAGGLYIPDNAKEKPQEGEVIAVGTGTKEYEMSLKVGDKVLYGKYSGTEVTHNGEKLLIMKETDVLAVIA